MVAGMLFLPGGVGLGEQEGCVGGGILTGMLNAEVHDLDEDPEVIAVAEGLGVALVATGRVLDVVFFWLDWRSRTGAMMEESNC